MTGDQHVAVLAAFDARVPKREIARRFGCHRNMIKVLVEARAAGRIVKPRPAPPSATKQHARWTPRDDQRLRDLWGSLDSGVAGVAAVLGRSELTTYWRARKLGLPVGAPQGWEYLTDAAKRTGFDAKTLRRLLRESGAEPKPALSRPTGASRTFHIVDPVAVDEAVELWASTEIVNHAAKRRGLCGETLRSWLVAEGHRPPRRKKGRWRLASIVIDAIVDKHDRLMSIAAHARRVGISRLRLADQLRAAGVLKAKRPGGATLVSIDAVDGALRRSA